jgi:oligopeptide/dipeptide ABC transporter ATP-binding protein
VTPLLEVKDVHVSFQADTGPVQVLNGVELSLKVGESLGIVGESGSGKTVLVRTILGLLNPPWQVLKGSVIFSGEDLLRKKEEELRHIRGKEIALTSPEPRKHLNPLLRVGDQIANVLQAHRDMPRKEAMQRAVELLKAVGIPSPDLMVRFYPHELSGGMCQRVIIAMALAHSPKLILADEPTAGLDVTISRQILDLMHDLVRDFNSSLILVSRDLGVVAHYCQRVAVIYAGQVVESAGVADFYAGAAHPYSRHLLRAAAAARGERRGAAIRLTQRMFFPDKGCAFASRCPIALPLCREEAPALEPVADDHWARCLRRAEVLRGETTA